ncbi:MAG TPA: transposase [bacterium]|mgnify:CR=1 FL=1|nr:transposase [bacterium]
MAKRELEIVCGNCYHVFNIAVNGARVFQQPSHYERFIRLIQYYRKDMFWKYTRFESLKSYSPEVVLSQTNAEKLVDIIAYCIMPNHFHIILKQVSDGGVAKFMAKITHSYAKFFNRRKKKIGPVWAGRYRCSKIETKNEFLCISRHLHMEPVFVGLVKTPGQWQYSSFNEYINRKTGDKMKICTFDGYIDINSKEYAKFVKDKDNYTKTFDTISGLIFENCLV